MRPGRFLRMLCGAVLVFALMPIDGCAREPQHPAVQAVRELLELRRADDRDPAKYGRFFAESSIASALVAPGAVPTGTPRVPGWRRLYPSKVASDSVEVAVVWREDAAFEDWPVVTVFVLSNEDGRWVVVDAREETSPPLPAAE